MLMKVPGVCQYFPAELQGEVFCNSAEQLLPLGCLHMKVSLALHRQLGQRHVVRDLVSTYY